MFSHEHMQRDTLFSNVNKTRSKTSAEKLPFFKYLTLFYSGILFDTFLVIPLNYTN